MSDQATPQEHPGAAIRRQRESLRLSREGLAYRAGVSLKTVERLEREEGDPRRATVAVILGVLREALAAEDASEPASTKGSKAA